MYKTVPDGTYYNGVTLIDGGVYRVLMWNDLLSIEGTDSILTMTFRLFDVTLKVSGLLQLLRDQASSDRYLGRLASPTKACSTVKASS